MSETKRAAEVSLTVEGDAETVARTDEALRDTQAADAKLTAAASSLEAFVSKAKDLAQKFGEM